MIPTLRLIAALLLPCGLGVAFAEDAASHATPDQRVDALLAAMGGREAWAHARFVYVAATHYTDSVSHPYPNEIWNDFSAPRVRLAATIEGDERVRAIDGDKGWRVRDGVTHALTPEQVGDELRWWESNVYRTLHRLAVRDPDLTPRAAGADRLEIVRADGKRLCWFRLTPRGEPAQFGTWDNDAGSVFGPLVVAAAGGVKHGRWGTSADGSFRYEITRFEASAFVPADISFSKP